MKKATGVVVLVGLGLSLAWAADRMAGWLGFQQQDSAEAEAESVEDQGGASSADAASPGEEGVSPATEDASRPAPELPADIASIEEDLARIEEVLGNEEVLEEFIPSEPLSADNPIPMPTDI